MGEEHRILRFAIGLTASLAIPLAFAGAYFGVKWLQPRWQRWRRWQKLEHPGWEYIAWIAFGVAVLIALMPLAGAIANLKP